MYDSRSIKTGDAFMFEAIVNGKTYIRAATIQALMRKASMAANDDFNAIDTLSVVKARSTMLDKPTHFVRINQKSPDNKIIRGKWT